MLHHFLIFYFKHKNVLPFELEMTISPRLKMSMPIIRSSSSISTQGTCIGFYSDIGKNLYFVSFFRAFLNHEMPQTECFGSKSISFRHGRKSMDFEVVWYNQDQSVIFCQKPWFVVLKVIVLFLQLTHGIFRFSSFIRRKDNRICLVCKTFWIKSASRVKHFLPFSCRIN